jgi:prepilin-type processing-associated H-X9-DG protein
MYSNVYNEEYPNLNGRAGLQMLATDGFLENTQVYTCPSTNDIVFSKYNISMNSSYAYAGGINEASSVDSGIVMDRSHNHKKYGNILFVDGHVKGYAGSNWSASRGDSHFPEFWRKPNPARRRRFYYIF